uniref:Synaptobrevin, longin-like domain protein n=1 Tax=Tanacetum cinerariifolium TaxID=118510 RepID=A0A6L2L468_TANCI|nr:hypothetical protein [Tanacetum cinerariifolium]
MSSLFAESHNMVAILEKSYAAEGFKQIIDFLSGSYINHALTVNPHVYISCIKQFWNTAVVKHSGDVTRLQALVDKKRIVITEEVVREILQLNDAEGIICLPNEEIFAGLTRIGYEKPSTKLTFYKAFFSTQWKFFIHTILHSLSAKRTSWNEFSSAMAFAVICLSSGQRFNFSNYIFESLVRNVDSSSKFYMYPRFVQLIIQTNIADLSTHTTRYISPALTQKVFANMRKVGKGFSGVETPLFENMLVVRDVAEEAEARVPAQGDDVQEPAAEEVITEVVSPTPTPPSPPSPVIPSSPPHQPPCPPQPQDAEVPSLLFQQVLDTCSALARRVEGLENDKAAQHLEIVKLKARVKKLEKINMVKSYKLRRLKKDEGIELVADQEKDAEVKGRHADNLAELYNLDQDHSSKVLSMQEDDTEVQEAVEIVTTAKLMTEVVTTVATRVVAASTLIPAVKPKILNIAAAPAVSTRRRKGVVIRDPEEELPSDTTTNTPKVKDKGKGILIEAPKPMKKKDQIEMDAEYAKKLQVEINKEHEKTYKDIDWNAALDHVQSKEPQYIKRYHGMKKKPQTESEARKNMIFYLKNTEGYKMDFFKGMKKRLEVVEDEDDDVFIEATPLAQKLLELMLLKRSKKNTKCVSAANEKLTAAKHKLMLLSKVKAVNAVADAKVKDPLSKGPPHHIIIIVNCTKKGIRNHLEYLSDGVLLIPFTIQLLSFHFSGASRHWLKFNNQDFLSNSRKEFRKRLSKSSKKEIERPEALDTDEFGALHERIALQNLNQLCRHNRKEKVTIDDLFLLHSMDGGVTVDVPWHVVKFFINKAKQYKKKSPIVGAHLIGRIAMYFGLMTPVALRSVTLRPETSLMRVAKLVDFGICKYNGLRYGEMVDDILENDEDEAADVNESQNKERGMRHHPKINITNRLRAIDERLGDIETGISKLGGDIDELTYVVSGMSEQYD